MTTAGPGVGNTAAGMMEAASMSIPVVHIGGAVAMAKRDTGDLQDMSTLLLMESVSKWARKVTTASRIPEYVSMAMRHATDASPGPVYLEIPTDLLFAKVDEASIARSPGRASGALPAGDPALVEEAAELLARAERPAMLIDDGARGAIGRHTDAVAELSDFLKPSVDADNGRGDPCVVESILFGPVEPHRQVEASVRGG